MNNEKEMTAPVVSVGADTEQSSQNLTDNSLTDFDPDFKGADDDLYREIQRRMAPDYLETVSMTTLYDTDFEGQEPLIDGLLYRGAYLLAGSPKVGKSFLMAQLAYQVSTGTPLWNYPVRKGTVLYLALEDDYRRLQERSYRMFGTAENESLFFSVSAGQLGSGLDEQLTNFLREHPGTSLIIIDTLQKVREVDGDNYSYANDYQIITRLKALADSYGISINENGHFAPGGYVTKVSDDFREVYHGPQDIPAEHRVFAYPQLSIREQMAAYQEIIDGSSKEGFRRLAEKHHEER
ncbi:MAG: AAA family ATPase [Oscillospiraceae bacterium]|jgi:hypothetical protein